MATEPRSPTAPCVDGELMPQRQVLEDEISAGADRSEECCDKQTEVEHRRAARGSPILCYLSIEPHGSSFAVPRRWCMGLLDSIKGMFGRGKGVAGDLAGGAADAASGAAGAASSAADQVVETAGDAAEAVVDAASGTVDRARDLIDGDGDGDEDAGDDGEERDDSPPA